MLIIEDEPLIVEVYQSALKTIANSENLKFEIESVDNCDASIEKLNTTNKTKKSLDIVFLDIRIPRSKNASILCGEDLGAKIRKQNKGVKIIVSTSCQDYYRVSSVLRNVNPDGFLVKSDLTTSILVEAIKKVIHLPPYYSQTVAEMFRKQSANDFFIDNIDRKLLYELSNGTKMSELPNVIPLSMTALERRKRIMKEIFNVTERGDRDLLIKAKEKGYI